MTQKSVPIIVPAEKLAAAVNKHLLPGLLRSLREEQQNATSTQAPAQPKNSETKGEEPI